VYKRQVKNTLDYVSLKPVLGYSHCLRIHTYIMLRNFHVDVP
jgi:hypothetical protein